jgi:hypothetical protein
MSNGTIVHIEGNMTGEQDWQKLIVATWQSIAWLMHLKNV